MIYDLAIKESAKEGAIEAFLYYESKQENLGARFLDCWEAHLISLQKNPLHHQICYKDFRQVLIKPFPYHIIYEIEGSVIIVYKVVYGGRHPEKRYRKK